MKPAPLIVLLISVNGHFILPGSHNPITWGYAWLFLTLLFFWHFICQQMWLVLSSKYIHNIGKFSLPLPLQIAIIFYLVFGNDLLTGLPVSGYDTVQLFLKTRVIITMSFSTPNPSVVSHLSPSKSQRNYNHENGTIIANSLVSTLKSFFYDFPFSRNIAASQASWAYIEDQTVKWDKHESVLLTCTNSIRWYQGHKQSESLYKLESGPWYQGHLLRSFFHWTWSSGLE